MEVHSVMDLGSMVSNFCPPGQRRQLCLHTFGQIQELSAQVGFCPGNWKGCSQMLQPVVDGPRLPSNARKRRSAFKNQLLVANLASTLRPCRQKTDPTGGKKVAASWPQIKRVLAAQKRGQAFCMSLIAGQAVDPVLGPDFDPKWDRKMQKKGTSLLFEGFRCGALPGVKFLRRIPQ